MSSLVAIITRFLGPKERRPEVRPQQQSTIDLLAEMEESCKIVVRRILEDVNGVNVDIEQDRDKRFILRVVGSLTAKVFLNFSSRSAEISDIFIDGGFRREGRCRTFTRALYTGLREIRFLKIELRAIDDGRVVWATLGFRPTPSSWEQYRNTISKTINAMRENFGGGLVDLALEALDTDDPSAFPIIANLRNPGDRHLSPTSLPVVILTSIPSWYGELEIGNPVDEVYLFG